MAKIGTLIIKGESGTSYKFNLYPLGTSFRKMGAVYVVTKRAATPIPSRTHKFIYVGETGDLSTRFENHHKQDCFEKHGANCIGVHADDSEKSRKAKEADLLAAHEWPCND